MLISWQPKQHKGLRWNELVRELRKVRKLNCAICAIPPETKNNSEDAKLSQAKGRIQTGVTLADASRMATLCEPSQAPKYGLKYGPAHAKKDKPATGAGLRGVYGGESVRRNPF